MDECVQKMHHDDTMSVNIDMFVDKPMVVAHTNVLLNYWNKVIIVRSHDFTYDCSR